MDFGCGLGRTTQALAEYFEEVYGVDIAPSILQIANAHNRHPERCRYILNETNNLCGFADNSVDLILSMGVLNLMTPHLSKNYIVEFLRILAPGGVAVFQLPSVLASTFKGLLFRLIPSKVLNAYRRSKYGFEVYPIIRSEVIKLVENSGGNILDIAADGRFGTNYVSYQYCIYKAS
jgi:ubiquinone/menaquinone biosynthesis C-methylase UbiE